MRAIGDSSLWRDQIVTAYDLVYAGVMSVWPSCRASIDEVSVVEQPENANRRTKSARRRHEDPITRNLVRRLRLVPDLRSRFYIISQYELIAEDLTQDPDPVGYLDMAILFSVGSDEVCLAIECKRLNVKGASLAADYVSEGMMRFVKGQYVPHLPLAAMIGYVMDGRVSRASESVLKQIRSNLANLCCAESSISFVSTSQFITRHARSPVAIELRHQLLSALQ